MMNKNKMQYPVKLIHALFLIALLSMIFSMVGCAAKQKLIAETELIKVEANKVRDKQKSVVELGGPICGLKELAIAESNRSFAVYEINQGDTPRANHHMDVARENIDLAYRKAVACEPPDRDGDGILDNRDKCPDDPEDKDGFEDEDGCPDEDNDKDGFLDAEDKCPDDAEDKDEFEDEDGCPDLDDDQDGILDTKDGCPRDPEDKDGFEDEDGCPDPDNDLDGLLDADDKCPNEPETFNGEKDDDGCPDESKYKFVEVTDKAIKIKQKIFFASGRSVILSKSFKTLNEVALAMKEHPKLKIEVGGHTDSNGSDKYNLKLSQKRAESVRQYLIKKGGIDGSRLTAKGYGEAKPIDTNKTRSGRSRNRRVEFNSIPAE